MSQQDNRREQIIDGMMTELLGRYGDRFDDAQRARLREEVANLYQAGQELQKLPLGNADEPELVFQPRTKG